MENLDTKISNLLKNDSDYHPFTEADKKKFADNLTKLFENADFGMNVPRLDRNGNNVLDLIFDSYFKNQIETGTGKGMVDVEERKRASHALFGTVLAKTGAREYEKYGFLMDKDMRKQARSGIADQYWSYRDGIQVRFKKDKVNPTFTLMDSLGSDLAPSLVRDPKLTSAYAWGVKKVLEMTNFQDIVEATREIARSYIELQYHGDLTLDMIESIYIPWRVREKISPATLEKMRATGAKIFSTELENGVEKLVEI